MELQQAECRARAQVEHLKVALDEHSLELRVKAANEAEAVCQQRLTAAEAEIAELRQRLDALDRFETWQTWDHKLANNLTVSYWGVVSFTFEYVGLFIMERSLEGMGISQFAWEKRQICFWGWGFVAQKLQEPEQ